MTDFTVSVRGVAHDLNNQIMILMNSLDRMMILCPDDPDARLALKAAEQCAELASQLLPQQRTRPVPGIASMREIICETAAVVRCLLPASNRLEVECHSDAHLDVVPAELQHALVNLCINAIDAMNGPGLLRLIGETEPGGVRITVQDTGPGVPEKLRERIFEPLFTTKAARGGNGLGLSRVRETVTNLGGSIDVYNVWPHGAAFRILLPKGRPTFPISTLQ